MYDFLPRERRHEKDTFDWWTSIKHESKVEGVLVLSPFRGAWDMLRHVLLGSCFSLRSLNYQN